MWFTPLPTVTSQSKEELQIPIVLSCLLGGVVLFLLFRVDVIPVLFAMFCYILLYVLQCLLKFFMFCYVFALACYVYLCFDYLVFLTPYVSLPKGVVLPGPC